VTSNKLQAPSDKLQATSYKRFEGKEKERKRSGIAARENDEKTKKKKKKKKKLCL
jgi:hypothetical protein